MPAPKGAVNAFKMIFLVKAPKITQPVNESLLRNLGDNIVFVEASRALPKSKNDH